MIGRLVVPFVKVALLDRKMFVQKTHPARRLLNALAEACEGNNGDSAAERVLMGKVEEIVDRLVAEFNENLAIFLTLEEEFRDFLSQHRRRVEIAERRATETQRGQEKLELARSRALSELKQRVPEDAGLPNAVEDFLRQPWLHHMTMAILRDGDEGPGTIEALAVADGVLEELAEARRHIVGKPWLQVWQPALHRVFASVGLHGDTVMVAITALHDTLQAIAEARPELEKKPCRSCRRSTCRRRLPKASAWCSVPKRWRRASTAPMPNVSARWISAPGWISSTRTARCRRANCRG